MSVQAQDFFVGKCFLDMTAMQMQPSERLLPMVLVLIQMPEPEPEPHEQDLMQEKHQRKNQGLCIL